MDPAESNDLLRAARDSNGYPWTVAGREPALLERYRVTSTSIKYAVDRNGVIAHAAGYGVADAASWRRLFDRLTAG